MTLSVHVHVPGHSEFTAEVTTVERKPDGRPSRLWHQVLKPGQDSHFYPHAGASIFIAEGHVGAEYEGVSNLATVFAFALGQQVTLVGSDERGTVIGRAEYAETARGYLIRYRAGDGRLTESWWSEPAIAPAAPAIEKPIVTKAEDPGPAEAASEATSSAT